MLAVAVAAVPGAIQSGVTCDKTSSTAATLKLKWNKFSSEWGAYEVEGCTGVNPKLQLTAGITYTWDQGDVSNWYHPVGFAYIAGGAHSTCQLTSNPDTFGGCPELGGESPTSTIQYYVNGVAITSDESGFGLDGYEPLFFNSQPWWAEASPLPDKPFKVTLTIPGDASYGIVYYFCHIHAGMSAEIEVIGSTASSIVPINVDGTVETQASAAAIYTDIEAGNPPINSFDQTCGTHLTYGPSSFSACTNSHFLCGPDSGTTYATCLKAIDCQMHHNMAVSVPSGISKFATFARQMIPHHQNAVAMAKVLAKFHTDDDYPPAGTEDRDKVWATDLVRNIINVQNFQIQQMLSWLDANPTLAGTSSNCYDGPPPPPPPPSPPSPNPPPSRPSTPPSPHVSGSNGLDDGAWGGILAGVSVACALLGAGITYAVVKKGAAPQGSPTMTKNGAAQA